MTTRRRRLNHHLLDHGSGHWWPLLREHVDLLGNPTWLIYKRVIHIGAQSELQTLVFLNGHLHDRSVLRRWHRCAACWIDRDQGINFRSCTFASRLNCDVHFGCLTAAIRNDWLWWHLDKILRGLARDLVDGRLSLLQLQLLLVLRLLLLLLKHVFFPTIR